MTFVLACVMAIGFGNSDVKADITPDGSMATVTGDETMTGTEYGSILVGTADTPGNLTIKSGEYGQILLINGSITIEDGLFQEPIMNGTMDYMTMEVSGGGELVINGGDFYGMTGTCGGTTTINGGDYKGSLYCSGGNLVINDANVSTNIYASIDFDDMTGKGTVTVNGGTFTETISGGAAIHVPVDNYARLKLAGGTFSAEGDAKAGISVDFSKTQLTAQQIVDTIVAEGYQLSDESFTESKAYDLYSYASAKTVKVEKKAEKSATLKFDTEGGDVLSDISNTLGSVIDLANIVPAKAGYQFDGWYTDAAFTNKVTSITLSENTTLYAKWVKAVTEGTAGTTATTQEEIKAADTVADTAKAKTVSKAPKTGDHSFAGLVLTMMMLSGAAFVAGSKLRVSEK